MNFAEQQRVFRARAARRATLELLRDLRVTGKAEAVVRDDLGFEAALIDAAERVKASRDAAVALAMEAARAHLVELVREHPEVLPRRDESRGQALLRRRGWRPTSTELWLGPAGQFATFDRALEMQRSREVRRLAHRTLPVRNGGATPNV